MNGIRPLADGVWVTEVSLREYDVRGVLLLGERMTYVWDTLSHPRDMAAWLPLVGDRSLTIAYSHADWDHVWGTAGLPHQQAVIIGHRLCLARFGEDVPRTLDEMRAAEPGSWEAVELIPPNEVFDEEMVLNLGSVTVVLRHLPGHTRDCCVAFVPERGLLDRWIAGLERWERDPRVQTVVPAHGAIGGREILKENARYLRGLRDGHPVEVPRTLTDFYRTTHESNLRAAKEVRTDS
jgi:glyoxylase-like metal-dependent hydrolase (beta-lactamase superfamily II)